MLTMMFAIGFFLLRYNSHIISHSFQLYNIVIQHVCTLWNGHHNKSSSHLSPYKVNAMSVTLFAMMYITSWWLFYCWKFILLDPLHPFLPPHHHHPFPSGNHQSFFSSINMNFVLFCWFIFSIPHVSEIMWYAIGFSKL